MTAPLDRDLYDGQSHIRTRLQLLTFMMCWLELIEPAMQ